MIKLLDEGDRVSEGDHIHSVGIRKIAHLHDGDRVFNAAVGSQAVDALVFKAGSQLTCAWSVGNAVDILAAHRTTAAAGSAHFVLLPALWCQGLGNFIRGHAPRKIISARPPAHHADVCAIDRNHVALKRVVQKKLRSSPASCLNTSGSASLTWPVPRTAMAFSRFDPQTAPLPRAAEECLSTMVDAKRTRFSPAWPMQATLRSFPCRFRRMSVVSHVDLPQRSEAL